MKTHVWRLHSSGEWSFGPPQKAKTTYFSTWECPDCGLQTNQDQHAEPRDFVGVTEIDCELQMVRGIMES